MNVLIVDDDKLARKGLVAIMDWKKYGFEVVGDVQNGRKALEFLRNHPVDIVFTDIDMPEIDGLELMQMCGEEFPEIKFVILSVYESFSYAQTAIRMGALDYISKISFSPEECGTILERVRAKYMQTCRDGHAEEEKQEKVEEEKQEKVEELNRRWMHTRWIFSEKEFENLCQKTKEISLRRGFLLRVFIIFSSCQMEKGNFHRWIRLKRCWTGCTAGGNIFMKRVLAHHRKMISVLLQRLSSMWMDISGRIFALKTWQNG